MSELIKTHDNSATIRWKLLTSASAAALIFSAYGMSEAAAGDSDRPQLWIELGGQLEQLSDKQESFNPSFITTVTQPNLLSAFNVQSTPRFSLGEDAKLSFQPEDSDWDFSATIRYGRSGMKRHLQHETPNVMVHVHITAPPPFSTFFKQLFPFYYSGNFYPNGNRRFADGRTDQSGSHTILDFQAGKDVGLGLFGTHGSSVVSAGVRIAQFRATDDVRLEANPDLQYPTAPISGNVFAGAFAGVSAFRNFQPDFHDYTGNLAAKRSYRGLGPSLSWDGSAAIAGNPDDGELTLDWGVNGAVLFGRQKAKNHVQTTTFHYHSSWQWTITGGRPSTGHGQIQEGKFFRTGVSLREKPHTTRIVNYDRAHSVTVPNLGGFAGLSMRYGDAKVSFGYRVDWFFNAIDAGIATRKSEDRGFYGPYASISIGLGD